MIIKSSNTLEKKFEQFNEKQIKTILLNSQFIQLTEGCSNGCNFCGLNVKKGPTDYISFNFLEELISRFNKEINSTKPLFYFKSEPFDYDFDGFNYLNVLDLQKKKLKYIPAISTAIPKGKEELILNLIKSKDPVNKESRISLSYINYDRLNNLWKKEINNTKNEKNIINFLHNGNIREIYHFHDNILDKYYSNSMHKNGFYKIEGTPIAKAGRYVKNSDYDYYGICSISSFVISPKGIFYYEKIKLSDKYKTGYKKTEINENNFNKIIYLIENNISSIKTSKN